MMTKLVEKVTKLVKEEYELASVVHGRKHNSPHEAAAVIFEEVQEASEEYSDTQRLFYSFWDDVKKNQKPEEMNETLKNMRDSAIFGACEMIQVAAMAHKAMHGYTIDEQYVTHETIFNVGVDSSDSDDMTDDIEGIIKEKEGEQE